LAPALVLWGENDRYLDSAWARRFAGALGGPADVEIVAGASHWPWLERSEVIEMVAEFLLIVS
jgi:pimeloyl-ACP methyl ester carboxylesterase